MITLTPEEFEKTKQNYRGLLFLKEDGNGSKYYETTCECDRCMGKKIVYKGVHNGQLVPHTPDNGVCWKCMGSGRVTVKLKIITPEHAAKLEEERRKKAQKEAEETAKRIADMRQVTYNSNVEKGYKEIDFDVEPWVDIKLEKYKYYRIGYETKRAYLLKFLNDLYQDEIGSIDRWVPITAFHKR